MGIDSNLELPPLVIDKSFAHAVKAQRLDALTREYTFLVPSAFYFEVLTTNAAKRRSTLTGFGEFCRVHIPSILREERESGQPVRSLVLGRRRFRSRLLSVDWVSSFHEAEIIECYKHDTLEAMHNFWHAIIGLQLPGFSKDELAAIHGSEADFVSICQTLHQQERVRTISGAMGFPHASIIDELWIEYRRSQVWALHALVLARRFPTLGYLRSTEKMEHDIHDLEYLILGLHAGALATSETGRSGYKMAWRFNLLAPNGRLVTPNVETSLASHKG